MQDKLIKIFKEAKYEPDSTLPLSVWRAIIIREKRMAKIKLWSFSIVGIASLSILIPVFEMLLTDLAHSGFYEYFSLIFSDGGSMITYWKELSLSLVESLPLMSIIFTLSLFFIFFLSLKYFLGQIGREKLMDQRVLSLSI